MKLKNLINKELLSKYALESGFQFKIVDNNQF